MGWDANNHRLTKGGVKLGAGWAGDFEQAAGRTCDSQRDLFYNTEWNRYAKWKTVRSTAASLPTEADRRDAGRTDPGDYSLQYGTRAYGVGNVISLGEIHLCRFVHEGPIANDGNALRPYDFFHPTNPTTYGYRSDAYIDLNGTIYHDVVPVGNQYMEENEVLYAPHSATLREEMLSIRDFLSNESYTQYDPNDMYPCALITQNDYHFIRGLYPADANATATLQNHAPNNMWRLNVNGMPTGTGTGQLRIGDPAVMSLFLVSQKIIGRDEHGTWNIDNWIVRPADNESHMSQVWEAWFCPIPDACGKSVYIGQTPPTGVVVSVTNIAYNIRHTSVQVFFQVANPGTTSDTWKIGLRGDGNSIIYKTIDVSTAATMPVSFTVDELNATGVVFVPGGSNTFTADAYKNNVATLHGMSATLVY